MNQTWRVYKFRALSDFKHVADIFHNHRFHTAHFSELNDPMEGRLYHCDKDTEPRYLDELRQGLDKRRICSFSEEYKNLLLWAHYADGFKGICIEVELDFWPDYEIRKVDYFPRGTWPHFSNDLGDYVSSWPTEVLTGKYDVWKYEKEVRVLTNEEYINHPMCVIKSVLLGTRISLPMKNAIIKLVPQGVKVFDTKISDSSNTVIKEKRLK